MKERLLFYMYFFQTCSSSYTFDGNLTHNFKILGSLRAFTTSDMHRDTDD